MTRIGFVGPGAVGSALARAFDSAGFAVAAVAGRTLAHAERLADEIPEAAAVSSPQEVVDRTDIVFLTVPDGSIAEVCSSLSWNAGTSVVHCSGAHSLDVLSHAAVQGARVGSFHPFQGVAHRDTLPDHFVGCMFGIEASDDRIRQLLVQIATAIGGWVHVISAGQKVIYHLAGVMASNYLVTLAAASKDLLHVTGLSDQDATRAIIPILRGTLDNIEHVGLPSALSGPIARGDTDTVALHLERLSTAMPGLIPLYRALALQTIPVATEKGTLDELAAIRLRELIETYREPRIEFGNKESGIGTTNNDP